MSTSTLWFESALLPHGWCRAVRLTVEQGRIRAVETGCAAGEADLRHAIGLPGLADVHSHAFQRALAGLTERRGAEPDSFWSWRELMYRFVERMTPDELEAVTAYAFAEMLEGGFTRVAEFHYVHHSADGTGYADPGELAARVVQAATATGINLTLLPVLYAHGGFGGAPPAPRQRRFINDLDGYARILESGRAAARQLPGAVVGVAAHSLRAVSPKELTAVVALAGPTPIHLHIAEQAQEVTDCLAWCGRRPLEWLLANEPPDLRWCLVHATQATAAELVALSATGAVVGLCPITESSLGDGIFEADVWVARGGRIGIGSDSNILIDAAAELRTLEYSQRLARRARNVLAAAPGRSTGRSLYEAALAGGAQATGAGEAGLVAGAWCDVVTLSPAHPALLERAGDELLDSWVFAAGRTAIDCVFCRGVRVVSQGCHVAREALLARYRGALGRLIT
jgi:formimidoylglutamate deiminase